MKKVLYLDAFSGVSGNMILGALLDLGVEIGALRQALSCLELSGWSIEAERAERQGLVGCHVQVNYETCTHHRTYADIKRCIECATLPQAVINDALKTFERLAVVEAELHGVELEKVHFHEVGAVDSIIDIVGTAWCLWRLSIDDVEFSTLPVSRGFVECAHGQIPLPAPATMQLLSGLELCSAPSNMEWITPTGAALITSLGGQKSAFPNGRLLAVGMGAGTKNPTSRANLLRACVFEVREASNCEQEVCLIETNLDDATPEEMGFLLEQLWTRQPYDVWSTPMMMKKNRLGQMISILCAVPQKSEFTELLFRHSSTFGVRFRLLNREILRREIRHVMTPYGSVAVKDGYLGEHLIKSAPEYDDCARLARANDISIRSVFEAVNEASSE